MRFLRNRDMRTTELPDIQYYADDTVAETKSDLKGVIAIFRYGRNQARRLLTAVIGIVAASTCVMIAARVLGHLVEALTYQSSGSAIAVAAVWFLTLEGLSIALHYFSRMSLARATLRITFSVRKELFRKIARLPIAYFDKQPLGRTITRLTHDIEGIETFFCGTLSRLVTAVIQVSIVLLAMLLTDLKFGLLIVAVSLPSLYFSIFFRKPMRFWMRIYKKHSAYLNAKLAEFISGMPVIRIFALESWSYRQYVTGAEHLLRSGLSVMNWNSFVRPVTVFLCSLPLLLILYMGGKLTLAGSLELGVLIAFIRYSERFMSPIRTITQEIQNIQEALVSSERIRQMLFEAEEEEALGVSGHGTLAQVSGTITFEDVIMEYEPGRPILKHLNCAFPAGYKVGLVGATGSGKTSAASLLPQFYPLKSGRVSLDGIDLCHLDRSWLRRQLGYVNQEGAIFSGTIRENLLATLPEEQAYASYSDTALQAACAVTGLDKVLPKLAGGLNYEVSDQGENLSMGEKQLLVLTSMYLRDPKILILDEATSHIDEYHEQIVQNAIDKLMSERTCIIIAHRLATIVNCDLLLVFRDGQIVEQGTHQQLMGSETYYKSLVQAQLSA